MSVPRDPTPGHDRAPPASSAESDDKRAPQDLIAQYDKDIAAAELEVAELKKAKEVLGDYLDDPIERSRRRHALRRAAADFFELAPQSDKFFATLGSRLPESLRWIASTSGRERLGWHQQADGSWRLDPARAPDLETAFSPSERTGPPLPAESPPA